MEILVGILAGILLIMLSIAVLSVCGGNLIAEVLGFSIFVLGVTSMLHPFFVKSELPSAEKPIYVSVDPAVKDKITTNTMQIQIVLPPTLIQK